MKNTPTCIGTYICSTVNVTYIFAVSHFRLHKPMRLLDKLLSTIIALVTRRTGVLRAQKRRHQQHCHRNEVIYARHSWHFPLRIDIIILNFAVACLVPIVWEPKIIIPVNIGEWCKRALSSGDSSPFYFSYLVRTASLHCTWKKTWESCWNVHNASISTHG